MSNIDNIPGTDDTMVTLTYEDVHEGWHSTGELEEDSVSATMTADHIAAVITNTKLQAKTSWGDELAIDVLREQDLLNDYERGSYGFEEYIADQIKENFYELDSLIECSIEQYDHKRGRCTVSSELKTTLGNLRGSSGSATGWKATVSHDGGAFSIDL